MGVVVDKEKRELERRVAQGDVDAELKLRRVLEREQQHLLLHNFLETFRGRAQEEGKLTVVLGRNIYTDKDYDVCAEPWARFARVWHSDGSDPGTVVEDDHADPWKSNVVVLSAAEELVVVEDAERTKVFLYLNDDGIERRELEELFPRLIDHFDYLIFSEDALENSGAIIETITECLNE